MRPRWLILVFAVIAALFALWASEGFGPVIARVDIRNPARVTVPYRALKALRHPEQMTLFSIDPQATDLTFKIPRFEDFIVLKSAEVTSREDQSRVMDVIMRGVEISDGSLAMCFNPRHGVRVVKGEEVYDFVVCFECGRVDIYCDRVRIATVTLEGVPRPFDAILQRAQAPLSRADVGTN